MYGLGWRGGETAESIKEQSTLGLESHGLCHINTNKNATSPANTTSMTCFAEQHFFSSISGTLSL